MGQLLDMSEKSKANNELMDRWLLQKLTKSEPIPFGVLYAWIYNGPGFEGRVRSLELPLRPQMIAEENRYRLLDRRLQALKRSGRVEFVRKSNGGPGWRLSEQGNPK